jgi:hypothetical protein
VHVYPVVELKLQVKHPAGHGPQVLLGVKKYFYEHVIQVDGLEQTLHPFGHPIQTPDTALVLISHCKQLKL